MRALELMALLLSLGVACTERVSLDSFHVGGSGGSAGAGDGGTGGGGDAGGGGGGSWNPFPCEPASSCSREGAVCSEPCTSDDNSPTSGRCMCVSTSRSLQWACARISCSDAGTDRRCPGQGDYCQPSYGVADCCAAGFVRYCLCPDSGPDAFNWQCRTINVPCN